MMRRIRKYIYRNIANACTFLRLISTCIAMYVLHLLIKEDYDTKLWITLVGISLVVWISDYCDGKLARKLKIESSFGAYFDVIVDFIFVFFMHALLVIKNVIPFWFLLVILEKILNYIITSWGQTSNLEKEFHFIKDGIGLFVVSCFYVTPILICFLQKIDTYSYRNINIVLYIISFLAIFSSVSRIRDMIKSRFLLYRVERENGK